MEQDPKVSLASSKFMSAILSAVMTPCDCATCKIMRELAEEIRKQQTPKVTTRKKR